jgi:hypothetical protein
MIIVRNIIQKHHPRTLGFKVHIICVIIIKNIGPTVILVVVCGNTSANDYSSAF